MITLALMAFIQAHAVPALPSGAVLEGHGRGGGWVQTSDIAGASPSACARACGLNSACQAWTYIHPQSERAGRCTLHPLVRPARLYPGAITGLSPELAAHIERAAERPPSRREQVALLAQNP